MNEIDRLVYLTIAYSSCFNFALTAEEIFKRIPINSDLQYLFNLDKKNFKKIQISEQKINNALKKMIKQSLIQTDGLYFFIKKKDLLNRITKNNHRHLKKQEAKDFVEMAKKIPFIKAIVLTGGAAVGNAAKDDDLDFMIICQKKTLWITRFLLILLIKLKNRRPGSKKPSAWCVNLLMDENNLALDANRRTLYEAYEILQMQFIFDRQNCQQNFLAANQWLKKYLFYYQNFHFISCQDHLLFSNSFLNYLFFYLQKTYRRLIFGPENFTLSSTQAFFNNVHFKEKLRQILEKRVNSKY